MSLLFDYGPSTSVTSLMTADICNQFKELGKWLHLTYQQFASQIGLGQEQNFLNGCLCFLVIVPTYIRIYDKISRQLILEEKN